MAILLAIILNDVGTVSRFSTLTFTTGLCFSGICEYNGQHITTTATVSAHLVQMQLRTKHGALGNTIRLIDKHEPIPDQYHFTEFSHRSCKFWDLSVGKHCQYDQGALMIIKLR